MSETIAMSDPQAPNAVPTRRPTVPAMEEMIGVTIPCLDHGFVRLVDYMGDDQAVVQAARVSYGTGTGRSKKEAEQQAAESAWRAIRAAADERAKAAAEAVALPEEPAESPSDAAPE